MLEELRDEVRPEHRRAVEEELARLDTTVARKPGDSVDVDRAGTPDPRGIGGRTEAPAQAAALRSGSPLGRFTHGPALEDRDRVERRAGAADDAKRGGGEQKLPACGLFAFGAKVLEL